MGYYVTNISGKDWRGHEAVAGTTLTETNDNYYFGVYPSPLIAAFLAPAYEGEVPSRLWEVEPNGERKNQGCREEVESITITKEIPVPTPSPDQHRTFGILAALQTVSNPNYIKWAMDWLSGRDRSQETAHAVGEKLREDMYDQNIPDEHNLVGAAHPAIGSVLFSPTHFSAYAALRAEADNPGIDLGQLATVVQVMKPEQIAQMLGDENGRPGSETVQHPTPDAGTMGTNETGSQGTI